MKQRNNSILPTIFEGIGFSLIGTLYFAFTSGFIEIAYDSFENRSGLVADYPSEPTIGSGFLLD